MNLTFRLCLLSSMALSFISSAFAAGAPVAYQFQSGTPAKAAEVNANFQELVDRIDVLQQFINQNFIDLDGYMPSANIDKTWVKTDQQGQESISTTTFRYVDGINEFIKTDSSGLGNGDHYEYTGYFRREESGYVQYKSEDKQYNPSLPETNFPNPDYDRVTFFSTPFAFDPSGLGIIGKSWGGHSNYTWQDLLQVGTGINEALSSNYSQYVLLGVEDVTTQAGVFQDCLKVSYTSLRLNGSTISTSIRWYAKGIGRIKYQYPTYIQELQSYQYQ